MNPTIAKMALEWMRAEHADRAQRGISIEKISEEDEICIAADRVYQVMMGEVRWSDAGPGDRAIWKGRLRDVARFEELWRTIPTPQRASSQMNVEENERAEAQRREEEAELERQRQLGASNMPNYPAPPSEGRYYNPMTGRWDILNPPPMATPPYERLDLAERRPPRLRGFRERMWANIYDTWQWNGVFGVSSKRTLFDGRNVGNYFLTNLQMSGQLASDQSYVMLSFYVSVTTLPAFTWCADNVLAMIVMGDKPQFGGPIWTRDLLMGVVPMRPLIVPGRQRVTVELYIRERPPDELDKFDYTFHFEGLLTRDVA